MSRLVEIKFHRDLVLALPGPLVVWCCGNRGDYIDPERCSILELHAVIHLTYQGKVNLCLLSIMSFCLAFCYLR